MNKLLIRVLLCLRKLPLLFETMFDKEFLAPDVPMSKIVSHQKWRDYIYEIGNKSGMKVLEIGSRDEKNLSKSRKQFTRAEYVGFDYY